MTGILSSLSLALQRSMATGWWDWTSSTARPPPAEGASETEKMTYYDGLVKRSVLVDSLSPSVTTAILTAALGQFGTVHAVKFLKSPLTAKQPGGCAIVEMEKPEQASVVESQMREYLFMISGMPRPARAIRATKFMLVDHPLNRKRLLPEVKFVGKKAHNADLLSKKRRTFDMHALEASYLLQAQKKEEEDLGKKLQEQYQELQRKYSSIKDNKQVDQLRRAYGLGDRME